MRRTDRPRPSAGPQRRPRNTCDRRPRSRYFDDPETGLRAYLIRLAPGATASPTIDHNGTELVAVVNGLVQIHLTDGRPVLRQGEALLADRAKIKVRRNLAPRAAALFWIIPD